MALIMRFLPLRWPLPPQKRSAKAWRGLPSHRPVVSGQYECRALMQMSPNNAGSHGRLAQPPMTWRSGKKPNCTVIVTLFSKVLTTQHRFVWSDKACGCVPGRTRCGYSPRITNWQPPMKEPNKLENGIPIGTIIHQKNYRV